MGEGEEEAVEKGVGLGGAVAEAARGVAEEQVEGTLWGVGRPVKRGEEVAGAEAAGVGEG